MKRESLFDRLNKKYNLKDYNDKINYLFDIYNYQYGNFSRERDTLKNIVSFNFTDWKGRGFCVSLRELLNASNYDELFCNAYKDNDLLLDYIDLIYNLSQSVRKNEYVSSDGNFKLLKDILDTLLEQLNYKALYNKKLDRYEFIENSKEIKYVAEILNDDLSQNTLDYTNRKFKGNLEVKSKILMDYSLDMENKRKKYEKVNKNLTDTIFFGFNKLNIRHNNEEELKDISNEEIEKYYDYLYELILILYIEFDNRNKIDAFNELKGKFK